MLGIRYWRVMDYIDHRGKNVVLDALNELPIGAKLAVNAFIQHIETWEPPFEQVDVKKLKNKHGQNCLGFSEFRITWRGNQYRPIVWFGPDTSKHQITIFAIAVEKNNRLVPFGICETCTNRLDRLRRNEATVRIHDIS